MAKNFDKTKNRDADTAAKVQKTASICRVSKRTVQRVINGDQANESVMNVFMRLSEAEKEVFDEVQQEHQLIDAIKKLVPFN